MIGKIFFFIKRSYTGERAEWSRVPTLLRACEREIEEKLYC